MPEQLVLPQEHKLRLDHWLAAHVTELSRARIKKLIAQGWVKINGQTIVKAGTLLKAGDTVNWEIPAPQALTVNPEAIALDIVYEDPWLLVINKPVGLVVHPGAGHKSGTLVNALLYHCEDLSGIGGLERPGIVHRLDKDTSGLLVVAKQDQAHWHLSEQLQRRAMKRIYWALVESNFRESQGTIEAPIGRHPVDRQRMVVTPEGRFARTHWQVLEHFQGYSLLQLNLDTGRTHQIRVHLKHIHHPLLGDPLYGSTRKHPFKVERPMLHAYQLHFIHPQTGQCMHFEVPPPEDFNRVLEILRRRWSHSTVRRQRA